MSYPRDPGTADSVDQVIQKGQSFSTPQWSFRDDDTHDNINRTPPLAPLGSHPNSPGTFRRDQASVNQRLNSQAGRAGRVSGDRGERENRSSHGPIREEDEGSGSSNTGTFHTADVPGTAGGTSLDFFSAEVFNIVIHNPTTAHRLLKFCQSRSCGENMEFLQKVDAFHRQLDELTTTLSSIHSTYTSSEAPRQINISHSLTKRISSDVRQSAHFILPSLESIFAGATDHVEKLLATDIYPRFVRHQVTAVATAALADHRERFQGLGDCFCLTDPGIADNPILFASDGFVAVTGYSRRDIIPRNCRFLQGEQTDPLSTRRLRQSIDDCEETVELLLNYRKNGDPFWNLLYVAPLLNEKGEVSFFLGGQINCSTTIHSCTDVLKVLSANDDELDRFEELQRNKPRASSIKSRSSNQEKVRSSFYKSFRKYKVAARVQVRDEAGMEPELIDRLGKLSFKTQVEAFYTAYSKYLVLAYHPTTQHLMIQHYSPGVIDMLGLNLPNGGVIPIFNKDIFKVLSEHSSSSSVSVAKAFKETVRTALRGGKAVSVETGLLTGYEERKAATGFSRLGSIGLGSGERLVRVEERYVTHWTPLKDEEGRVRWVVLTIAPKM